MKLMKFGAAWCGSCKTLENNLKNWDATIAQSMESYDIDDHMSLARQYQVKSLPTVIAVDVTGNEVARFNGAALTQENLMKLIS